MSRKKIILGILVFVILAAGLVGGLLLLRQQQEIRKKAVAATTVSILPATTTARVGEDFDLTVEMNTATNTATAADIQITYDTAKLTLKSLTPSTFLPVVLVAPQVNNTTGSATVTVGTQPANPPQGKGTLATLRFTAKAAGTANVSLGPATRATGIQEGTDIIITRNASSVTILAAAGATPTPTPVPTTTPGTTLTPTPVPTSASGAGSGGAVTTPTPTPTKKPATSPAAATSGAQPVAGVALPAVGLLVGGMLVIMLGVLLLAL